MTGFDENRILNIQEFRAGKRVLESFPRLMRVVLNNYCDIDCIMCDIAGIKDKKAFPVEKMREIKELFPFLERVNWQGGEVFLVDYFRELFLEAAGHKNIRQEIQTNGLQIDDEWADMLISNNASLIISAHGVDDDTYGRIHRRGRFSKLVKNLENIKKYRMHYKSSSSYLLTVCVMRSNYRKIRDFVEFAMSFGFDMVTFSPIRRRILPGENIFEPGDREALDFLTSEIKDIKDFYGDKIRLEFYFESLLKKERIDGDTGSSAGTTVSKRCCRHPWTSLHVDILREGNVYPECMCATPCGNFYSESLMDIWNGKVMQDYRNEFTLKGSCRLCSKACVEDLVPADFFDEQASG